jgi:hypothetical protein
VNGGRDNRGEKQLMIINGEGEFDQDVLTMGSNFKLEYQQLLEPYNRRQCAMVLIKNMVANFQRRPISTSTTIHNIQQAC